MTKDISVVIPLYNHANTLGRSLRSLLAQTLLPSEVVIVNDGSTDNYQAVLDKILPTAQKLRVPMRSINQSNLGANNARNHGLSYARGEYVIFWDADTIAQPEMLDKMWAALALHPEASYVYSRFKFGWKKIKSHVFDPVLLKKLNYVDTVSLVRRVDLPTPAWDESLNRFQDWDLWLTMWEKGRRGVFVPEYLYKKITKGRTGMSAWLPAFVYRVFPRCHRARAYQDSRKEIILKHQL